MPETLYLIDGHAQIFRAYYAIRGGLRSPVTGEPTGAVFGFTGMLLKLISQFHPHYVVVAVDMPGKTFRDELYDGYKGTRGSAPDDLPPQIPRILEVIDLFGIPVIGQAGLEADDVIASITDQVLSVPSCAGVNIRLVSKDKDLEQLLGDRVTMFDIHTDTIIDVAWLKENKGITPEQVVDLLALTGDTVDNIPGVDGIGPKTAAQLIQEFGSMDGILAHLDQIKGKRRENIEKARDRLPLNRHLVTLKRNAGIPFSLEDARLRPVNVPKLLPLFQQLGFNRYQDDVRRLAAEIPSPLTPVADDSEQGVGTSGPGSSHPEGETSPLRAATPLAQGTETASGDYEAVTTAAQLDSVVSTLRRQSLISVDTETTSLARDAQLCGLSFAWEPGLAVYVPVRSPQPADHLDAATVIKALRPILEADMIPKCGHNLKFDAFVLLREGIRLRGVGFDSMLASLLLDRSQPVQLDQLALSQLNRRMIPITDLIGEGAEQLSMAEVPLELIVPYAAEDADIALQLARHLAPLLEETGLTRLLRDIEAPLTVVLAEMEHHGILCDSDELLRLGAELGKRVDELRKEIHAICGVEFQIESTRQLAEVLFDRLGLERGKRTKIGWSTDIQVLEKLAADEDLNVPRTSVPRLIIEYRHLTKLISTYLGNLRSSIDPKDGRIHTTFYQLDTATGRLASQNPNLQNIPVRTDVGRQIRKAFLAPPGHLLISADYSQIELRLLAHLSEDPALTQAFEQGLDIHTAVAAQVFHVPIDAVTREQRSHAKTINFGIIYGITPFGLARRIEGLDVPRATQLITEYRQRFPGIDRFLQQCIQQAIDRGYVTTITGRRRPIPEIYSPNANIRNLGERLAINSVVQGSAADLIKIAMVNLHRRIDHDQLPLKMLLQIHDELVIEALEPSAQEHARIVCEEMERAMTLRVPLKAEAGIGRDWLSCK
jgi:DNA polymerase-1